LASLFEKRVPELARREQVSLFPGLKRTLGEPLVQRQVVVNLFANLLHGCKRPRIGFDGVQTSRLFGKRYGGGDVPFFEAGFFEAK
jgi:hypothetical protein